MTPYQKNAVDLYSKDGQVVYEVCPETKELIISKKSGVHFFEQHIINRLGHYPEHSYLSFDHGWKVEKYYWK